MTTAPTNPFGTTSPCLFIARHYGVDWLVTLSLADWLLHNRPMSAEADALIGDMPIDKYRNLADDVRAFVVKPTRALWAQGATK